MLQTTISVDGYHQSLDQSENLCKPLHVILAYMFCGIQFLQCFNMGLKIKTDMMEIHSTMVLLLLLHRIPHLLPVDLVVIALILHQKHAHPQVLMASHRTQIMEIRAWPLVLL